MDVEKFGGFTPPVSNYFRMPNEWINICAEIKSLAELKVVQYVLRHTWGWQEYDGKPKTITIDEFMHGRKDRNGNRMDKGTGLSNRSVIDGVRSAIDHGYLVCEVDDTDRARVEKSYALQMTDSDVKILHSKNRCEESSQPDMKKVHSRVKNLHSDCEESSQRSEKDTKEKHFKKEREKDSVAPTSTQEPQPLSQPNVSPSLSLSQKNEEETKLTEVNYDLFDRLCHEKGYASDFKVSRCEKNDTAIQQLRSQNATVEQVTFVFNDVWDDRDPFWKQHRGKPTTIASQFIARVWKMTAPTAKRQTLTGVPNYTEDRIGKPAQEAKPAPSLHIVKTAQPTYGPKLDQTPTYTRLKIEKPTRGRSLQARLQQEKEQG